MSTYKHPGVYVEEISNLPPSVAEVSTAVPAFIGYTETHEDEEGNNLLFEPTRISTFLEYQTYFGGPQSIGFDIAVIEEEDNDGNVINTIIDTIAESDELIRFMYHSVDLYFKNGGGPCYIVSVGDHSTDVELGGVEGGTPGLADGLQALEKKDEPTLIVIPDAGQLIDLSSATDVGGVNIAVADYYSLYQQTLAQCANLGDRFAILDVPNLNSDYVTDELNFRTNIGTSDLKYGAAYYPDLKTSLTLSYDEADVSITGVDTDEGYAIEITDVITITYTGALENAQYQASLGSSSGAGLDFIVNTSAPSIEIINIDKTDENNHTGAEIVAAWGSWTGTKGDFDITLNDPNNTSTEISEVALSNMNEVENPVTLASIASTNTALYNEIKSELGSYKITLPPGAAIAGAYAKVDRDRGVWKAPANVSLASVIRPTMRISDAEQGDLNVDTNGGKSINCIRRFQGKGTLIWGARTLAGNDNEWRYVSVRRLFNVIEESVKKATFFAVFEPNDAPTWQKVKGMIEGYLYQLWKKGALAGSTAETSYFVNVGLGTTMSTQDILEGRMIAEIGVAAVRPAEFIILRFSHKLQES